MVVLLWPEKELGISLLSGLTKLWTGLMILCEAVLLLFKVMMMFLEGVTVLCWFPVPIFCMLGLWQAVLFLGAGTGSFVPESPLCVLVESVVLRECTFWTFGSFP